MQISTLLVMISVALSGAAFAQSTVIQSARSLIEKDRLEGPELERVRASFISLMAMANHGRPPMIQGPATRQTAIGDLYGAIDRGNHFWEVKYFDADTQLISMVTFVVEGTNEVIFVCDTHDECAGK